MHINKLQLLKWSEQKAEWLVHKYYLLQISTTIKCKAYKSKLFININDIKYIIYGLQF
jgi:hypothetical protein